MATRFRTWVARHGKGSGVQPVEYDAVVVKPRTRVLLTSTKSIRDARPPRASRVFPHFLLHAAHRQRPPTLSQNSSSSRDLAVSLFLTSPYRSLAIDCPRRREPSPPSSPQGPPSPPSTARPPRGPCRPCAPIRRNPNPIRPLLVVAGEKLLLPLDADTLRSLPDTVEGEGRL